MSYPVKYFQGDKERLAYSPTDEVDLKFRGFSKDGPVLDIVDYRELQKEAKELGIPANQSAVELSAAIDAKMVEDVNDRFGQGNILDVPAPIGGDES